LDYTGNGADGRDSARAETPPEDGTWDHYTAELLAAAERARGAAVEVRETPEGRFTVHRISEQGS
jgi:hypothetical protein